MLTINTYNEFKSYVYMQLRMDKRIASIIWGEDKRMLDEQRSAIDYPCAHVYNIEDNLRATGSNNLRDAWIWGVEILKNEARDNIEGQEAALELCHDILRSFALNLNQAAKADEIYYQINNESLHMIEGDQPDDLWGWAANMQIATPASTLCANNQEVRALQLCTTGDEGSIMLKVGNTLLADSWTLSELNSYQMASRFVDAINNKPSLNITAELLPDGRILLSGDTVTLDITQGVATPHFWKLPYELQP